MWHTTVICTWCTSTTEAAIQCNMVHLYTAVQDDEDLNYDQFMDFDDDDDDDDDDVVYVDWLISDDTNDTNDDHVLDDVIIWTVMS